MLQTLLLVVIFGLLPAAVAESYVRDLFKTIAIVVTLPLLWPYWLYRAGRWLFRVLRPSPG